MKYIIFIFIIKHIISQLCDPENVCLSCNKIQLTDNDNPCLFNFFNGFCYHNTISSYISNNVFISRFGKNQCTITNEPICGKSEISEEINDENYYYFLSFENTPYLEYYDVLCYYTFTNSNKKEKKDIIFEVSLNLTKRNINKLDNGRNRMFIFVQGYDDPSIIMYEYNLNEYWNKNNTLSLGNYKSFSIYVSLIKNNYNFNNDNMIDSINLGVKINKTESENVENNNNTTLIICLLCLFLIICVIVIIIICICKRRKNRELKYQREIGMEKNMNELNNRGEYKMKLKKLFKDKLKKQIYSKNLNINDTKACFLCSNEFLENLSVICVTPCTHIFHYFCLHETLFTENSENSNCLCPCCNYNLLSKNPPQKEDINKDKNDNNEKSDDNDFDPNSINSTERIIKKRRKKNNDNNTNEVKNKTEKEDEKDINDIKIDMIGESKNPESQNNDNIQSIVNSQNQSKNQEEDNDNNISFDNNGNIAKQKKEVNNSSNSSNMHSNIIDSYNK